MNTTKTYTLSDLVPSAPVHPGEIVKDELEARGISQRKFASVIGCSNDASTAVLNSLRLMTAHQALRIEAALGIKAYMLVNMQGEYNLQTARKDTHFSSMLNKIRAAAAVL